VSCVLIGRLLHHGAGSLSWLRSPVDLLCLQDHPPEHLHGGLGGEGERERGREGERERDTHTIIYTVRMHDYYTHTCSRTPAFAKTKPNTKTQVIVLGLNEHQVLPPRVLVPIQHVEGSNSISEV